jgi:hypothetical protein
MRVKLENGTDFWRTLRSTNHRVCIFYIEWKLGGLCSVLWADEVFVPLAMGVAVSCSLVESTAVAQAAYIEALFTKCLGGHGESKAIIK